MSDAQGSSKQADLRPSNIVTGVDADDEDGGFLGERQSSLLPGEIRTPMIQPPTPVVDWANMLSSAWSKQPRATEERPAIRTPLTGYGTHSDLWEKATASPMLAHHAGITSSFTTAHAAMEPGVSDAPSPASVGLAPVAVVGEAQVPSARASAPTNPEVGENGQPATHLTSVGPGVSSVVPLAGGDPWDAAPPVPRVPNPAMLAGSSGRGAKPSGARTRRSGNPAKAAESIIAAAGLPLNISSITSYLEQSAEDMPVAVQRRFSDQRSTEKRQSAASSPKNLLPDPLPVPPVVSAAPAVAGYTGATPSYRVLDPAGAAVQYPPQQLYSMSTAHGSYVVGGSQPSAVLMKPAVEPVVHAPVVAVGHLHVNDGGAPAPLGMLPSGAFFNNNAMHGGVPPPVPNPLPQHHQHHSVGAMEGYGQGGALGGMAPMSVEVGRRNFQLAPRSTSELLSNMLHFHATYFPPPPPPRVPASSRRARAELWYHFAFKWDITHRLPPPPRTPLPEMEMESRLKLMELTRTPYRGDRWLVRSDHWFTFMQSHFDYPFDSIGAPTSKEYALEECVCE